MNGIPNAIKKAVVNRSRPLLDPSNVLSQNAWDNVSDPSALMASDPRLQHQLSNPVSISRAQELNAAPAAQWDKFYELNGDKFFKDRAWLTGEFKQLDDVLQADAGSRSIVEVGAGVGNSFFPLLEQNRNPNLTITAADYSAQGIKIINADPKLHSCIGSGRAVVWDLSSGNKQLPQGVSPGSVDIVLCVFVLSALHPDEWRNAVLNIHLMLKPGGRVFIRDYGRYDLAQMRMKKDRLINGSLYARGDGTRVYFFTPEELSDLFIKCNFEPVPISESPLQVNEEASGVEVDRRLLVNRKLDLKMYRVWLQGRFQKGP